jgi:hypothetical protein
MWERVQRTWRVLGVSWDVLKKDKELLLISLLSLLCEAALLASFILPVVRSAVAGNAPRLQEGSSTYYFWLFLLYFSLYLVSTYFNTAIAACVAIRLRGRNPTLNDGFRTATECILFIVGWALFAATVGLALRMIEDRSRWLGRLVAGLLGVAFSVAGFLVVPVIAVERVGPVTALKTSSALLKKTWGDQVVGSLSFALLFFLLALPSVLFLLPGMMLGRSGPLWIGLALAVLYLLLLGLVQNTLQAVFRTAVYLYARNDTVPPGFPADMLQNAMTVRR